MCCFLKVTATKTLLLLSVFVFSNVHTVFIRQSFEVFSSPPAPPPPKPSTSTTTTSSPPLLLGGTQE